MNFDFFTVKDPKEDLDQIIFSLMPVLDARVDTENTGLRTDKGEVIKEPGQKSVQILRDIKSRFATISIKDSVMIALNLDSSGHWRAMVKTDTSTMKIHDVETPEMITMILKVI